LDGVEFPINKPERALQGSAQQMIDAVIAAVDDFRGARELRDDLTIVALQLQPAPARAEPPAAAL
jgi:hypothetical protein